MRRRDVIFTTQRDEHLCRLSPINQHEGHARAAACCCPTPTHPELPQVHAVAEHSRPQLRFTDPRTPCLCGRLPDLVVVRVDGGRIE